MYYNSHNRDNPGVFFPLPKAIFNLGLTAGEIAVYAFLMLCEDRKTFKCHPSYSTIGCACGMSRNTVRKYVESLERKGFISTKPTKVITDDGRTHNGSLEYTLQPISQVEKEYNKKMLRRLDDEIRFSKAVKKLKRKVGDAGEAFDLQIQR